MCVFNLNGVLEFELREGAYNSELFIDFINRKLINYFALNPQKILIMDNAKFHHSREVLNFLHEKRISYKFLPPYSPQLNPIEEFFSLLKSRYIDLKNPEIRINETLNQVFQEDFSRQVNEYYIHMNEWLEKARQRRDFI